MKHLPVNEKFLIYRDEDGDYVIEPFVVPEGGIPLRTHGETPDEAVHNMNEVLRLAWLDSLERKAEEEAGAP